MAEITGRELSIEDAIARPFRKFDFIKVLPDNSVVMTKPLAQIIIPASYEDHHIAEIIGNEFYTFGVFNINVWDDEEGAEDGKPAHRYLFRFPSKIHTVPSEFTTRRNADGEKEYVLTYYEGATFITSTLVQKDTSHAKQFLDIMVLGYLPDSIPYQDIAAFWDDVNTFNGIEMKAGQVVLELITSQLCRNPTDLSEPFRHAVRDNTKINMLSRKMINIMNIPRYVSSFSGISSAWAKPAITSAIANKRAGKKEVISPLEQAIE
jgi:hypothetical protein